MPRKKTWCVAGSDAYRKLLSLDYEEVRRQNVDGIEQVFMWPNKVLRHEATNPAKVGDRVVYKAISGHGEYDATVKRLRGGVAVDIEVNTLSSVPLDLSDVKIVPRHKLKRGTCSLPEGPNGKI